MNLPAIFLLTVIFALCALYVCIFAASETVLRPRQKNKGDIVAEVWLEWPICRGSTMYRQRFSSKWQATLFVRFYALILDWQLPKGWATTDYLGRPTVEAYEFGIAYGIRKLKSQEEVTFHPVWSVELPGHTGYTGEHALAHPMIQDDALSGYKL